MGDDGSERPRVDYYAHKLIFLLYIVPVMPWVMAMFGHYPLRGNDVRDIVLFALLGWPAGIAIAWRVGGSRYVLELICWTLTVTPFVPWLFVILGQEPVPRGVELARAVAVTAGGFGLAALIAWRSSMWPFASGPGRRSE